VNEEIALVVAALPLAFVVRSLLAVLLEVLRQTVGDLVVVALVSYKDMFT
jgi:hypothetical protein